MFPQTSGLSFGKPEQKMGMKVTDFNGAIYFDDVRVPKEYRAGGTRDRLAAFQEQCFLGRL